MTIQQLTYVEKFENVTQGYSYVIQYTLIKNI